MPTTFGGEPKKMNFNTTICL
ncbi:hypothetical protein ACRCF2_13100 [Staphylococcus aureus]